MKLHRFIGDFDFSKTEIEISNPEQIKQIRDVLRLEQGDTIILSDGRGQSAEVSLTSVSSKQITGTILKLEKSEEISRKVTLYLAILKKENFELAVQKAVEVGVSEIVPVITERTIKTGLNIERLNKIIVEASEQSGRSIMPAISPILDFEGALIAGNKADEKIIFDLDTPLYSPEVNAKNTSIFVGPEGGFTEKEVALAQSQGYKTASLGSLTLRGETAAIVATYRAVEGI